MAGLAWSYPATDHGEIPAQKGGRAALSIALAVATAHKHDAKGTVKASKSLSGRQGSSLVCAHCHGPPIRNQSAGLCLPLNLLPSLWKGFAPAGECLILPGNAGQAQRY